MSLSFVACPAVLPVLIVLGVTGCTKASSPQSPVLPATSASGVSVAPASSVTNSPTPHATAPRFASRISRVAAAKLRFSWRPGCPVPIEDLRLLTLSYWGFDGAVHTGELVVHQRAASDVVRVFDALFRARFPIQRMVLVDEYGGDDERSMEANNTSAFNCRPVTGGTRFSEHSYGLAIDVNPIQNPYVYGDGTVLPPAGAQYVDRSFQSRGMIHAGDVVVDAFAAVGWEWGGDWSSIKDFQHFSLTGR